MVGLTVIMGVILQESRPRRERGEAWRGEPDSVRKTHTHL